VVKYLLGVPIILITLMIQLTIFSRTSLLYGKADLVLLVIVVWAMKSKDYSIWLWVVIGGGLMSLISATPFLIPMVSYAIIAIIVEVFQKKMWQMPIIAMFIVVMVGTFIQHAMYFVALSISGSELPFLESINLVTLPSLMLNLLLSLPVYILVSGITHWFAPIEVEA
jgi:rod shape-determining protein MreD